MHDGEQEGRREEREKSRPTTFLEVLLNGHALRQEENDDLTAARFMCDE